MTEAERIASDQWTLACRALLHAMDIAQPGDVFSVSIERDGITRTLASVWLEPSSGLFRQLSA